MKAFVTGGAGFLGYQLVRLLVAENWEVSILDTSTRHRESFNKLGVETNQGSITDTQKVLELVNPGTDAIFHIAGNTSLWSRNNRQQSIDNIQGTASMLDVARLRQVKRFIHTSSFTVYGFQATAFTEKTASTVMRSGINYFISKALAERRVKDAACKGLDTVIVNPANIMGPFDYRNWSQLFILIDQGRLPGAPTGKASFACVEDVAAAHLSAFHRGRSGDNYLLGGVDISYLNHIQAIGAHIGRKTPKHAMPYGLLAPLAGMRNAISYVTRREPEVTPEKVKFFSGNLCCDDAKARDELDYRSRSLQDMIIDTTQWLRAEGMISDKTQH